MINKKLNANAANGPEITDCGKNAVSGMEAHVASLIDRNNMLYACLRAISFSAGPC